MVGELWGLVLLHCLNGAGVYIGYILTTKLKLNLNFHPLEAVSTGGWKFIVFVWFETDWHLQILMFKHSLSLTQPNNANKIDLKS